MSPNQKNHFRVTLNEASQGRTGLENVVQPPLGREHDLEMSAMLIKQSLIHPKFTQDVQKMTDRLLIPYEQIPKDNHAYEMVFGVEMGTGEVQVELGLGLQ